MPTVKITDADFEAQVINSDVPVLVDFWAEWCGPCKMIAPVLEKLADRYAGRAKIAKLDIDANPGIAGALRIQSIPTMILFKDGSPIDAVQGAQPEEALVAFLEPHLSAASATAIAAKDLAARLESGQPTQIFDLRAPFDFSRSHLRGSQCVDAERLQAGLQSVTPGTLVVLVCRTGEISEAAVKEHSAPGLQVVALTKGILDWEGDLLPTYSDKEEEELEQQEAAR